MSTRLSYLDQFQHLLSRRTREIAADDKSMTHWISHRVSLKMCRSVSLSLAVVLSGLMVASTGMADTNANLNWDTVVNNTDAFPGDSRNFNSYNQPSVNDNGIVVFRARTQGGQPGGEPSTGIFTRDMSSLGNPLNTIATRNTIAPLPSYTPTPGYTYSPTDATFNEFPAIPRIDRGSSTIATRGQTPPVIEITDSDDVKTSAGTSAIYTNPGGALVSAVSNFGNQPGFDRYLVPGQPAGTKFDQFPGAPTVADISKVAFKGNFSGGTGIYWTDASDPTAPINRIADTTTPGQAFTGGSTAPPSAANGKAVFLGVDNEEAPTQGGIYVANLEPNPTLQSVVTIGSVAPGFSVNSENTFTKLGEALSFDGRYVAFWGGVGSATNTLTLECPTDGNQALIDYCNQLYPDGFTTTVPTYQGIYLADLLDGSIDLIASTWGSDGFTDFIYWGFSGRPPGVGGGDEEAEELARWRSTSFIAGDNGMVAFKGSKGDGFGLYLHTDPSSPLLTIAEAGADGSLIDPDAAGMPIVGLGIERDGFRNSWLAITASMANETESMAGVYVATVPELGTMTLCLVGFSVVGLTRIIRFSSKR